MEKKGANARFYEFDCLRVDVTKRQLFRDGKATPLKPKTFETLLVLLENAGRVVSKDDLMNALWPDVAVEEANLTQHISLLRKALGDSSATRFIVTHSGRGYEFVRDVRVGGEGGRFPGKDLTPAHMTQANSVPILSAAVAASHGGSIKKPTLNDWRWPRKSLLIGLPLTFVVIASLFVLIRHRVNSVATAPLPKSIAVLPFKSLNAGTEDEFLGMGLTDALITQLNNDRQLIVRPTNAVLKYGNSTQQDARAAGKELGVEAVLTGIVEKSGDRVRVTAQLIDVRDGALLWAQTMEQSSADLFQVQDALTTHVAQALTLKLTGDETKALTKKYTNNAEAYQLFLRAHYLCQNKNNREGMETGISLYHRAIELDSNFALAYVGLGNCSAVTGKGSQKEANQAQKAFMLKALEIDAELVEAHSSLAHTMWRLDWDWPGAEREFKRAIELNPTSYAAHGNYGLFLVCAGRLDEGLREGKRSVELYPVSAIALQFYATDLLYARRYDESIGQARRILEIQPGYAPALNLLALAYGFKGMYSEAIDEINKAINPSEVYQTSYLSTLGYLQARSHHVAFALKTIERLKSVAKQNSGSYGGIAAIYIALGDNERALPYLEKSIDEDEYWPSTFKVNPFYDTLRSDLRFAKLLQRIRLLT